MNCQQSETFSNETAKYPKSPTVSLGIQKMAMFAQTQEPPFDDNLPTSVHQLIEENKEL